ncbi:MAG TPA: hypothetical protein VKM55_18685 [Candidatus Lokiarchaeia archaeon]|nr:hypothetical protein [Candidatus Lokiarchaeia archaeon]
MSIKQGTLGFSSTLKTFFDHVWCMLIYKLSIELAECQEKDRNWIFCMKSSISLIHRQESWISRLKCHIFLIAILLVGLICSILINILSTPFFKLYTGELFPTYGDITDFDMWFGFAASIKYAILNNGAGFNSFLFTSVHAFTPLFPGTLSIFDLIFNNMVVSAIILNGVFNVGTLFVLRKIVIEFYHLEGKDALIILIIYQSNFVICMDSALMNVTMPAVALCITLAFYTNTKLAETPNFENGMKVFLTNTLVVFCREIIWPFLMVGPILVVIKDFEKINGAKHRISSFLRREFKTLYFSIALPLICYLEYFLLVDAFPSIFRQLDTLSGDNLFRTVPTFLLNAFIAFNVMPFLILFNIKGIFKKKENFPLIIWTGIFFIIRFLIPGPLWAHYWEPVIFCISILCFQSLQKIQCETKKNRIVSVIVSLNLALLFFAVIFPRVLFAIYFYPFGPSVLVN